MVITWTNFEAARLLIISTFPNSVRCRFFHLSKTLFILFIFSFQFFSSHSFLSCPKYIPNTLIALFVNFIVLNSFIVFFSGPKRIPSVLSLFNFGPATLLNSFTVSIACFIDSRLESSKDASSAYMDVFISLLPPRGGGSVPKCGSMLEQISVWNGGSEIYKLCGSAYTQNGGNISWLSCNTSILSKQREMSVKWWVLEVYVWISSLKIVWNGV